MISLLQTGRNPSLHGMALKIEKEIPIKNQFKDYKFSSYHQINVRIIMKVFLFSIFESSASKHEVVLGKKRRNM